MVEAAEILGVTERTFRRWSTRYEVDGVAGLENQPRAGVSPNTGQIMGSLHRIT